MELRSRRSLKPNNNMPVPEPAATARVPQQREQHASSGRFATEPPVEHNHEKQQNLVIEVKKDRTTLILPAITAVRASVPTVPASRAKSTPVTLLPQDRAFDILEWKFGKGVSTENFSTYRRLISDRVTLFVDDSSRRFKNSWQLQEFFGDHPGVLHIHNKFARSYNRTKPERFHLPDFKPRSVIWRGRSVGTQTATAGEQLQATETSQPPIVKPILQPIMEMSKADDGPGVNHVNPGDGGDEGNMDVVPEILHLEPITEDQDDMPMAGANDEQAHFERDEASTRVTVVGPPPGDQAAQQEEREPSTDAPYPAVTGQMKEQAHAKALRISADERAARPERAQAYLAWLQHRQARFPTVRPNFSECVLVAKKLGRPSVGVHEDVLHYWSLETDSRRGEWYKQNRLHTLGEDPRFDSEHMSMWKAWLKQGRDEMERKNSAMDVDGRNEE